MPGLLLDKLEARHLCRYRDCDCAICRLKDLWTVRIALSKRADKAEARKQMKEAMFKAINRDKPEWL